ncbi:hypothetical protein BDV35DRAFT_375173 [Aspergillus flavus]|uniref:Uncharacterized protein n=1 Tax=Aspergillus flavus TaxID=5059 RepID=A0A5N6GEV1_ASPFL|nr:hypothetical protein BDV35DRAFT_375173 [Aspergillus flavus]
MTETLLSYLTRRNPRVETPGLARSTFTFNDDWGTVEKAREWSEFSYKALLSKFGEELKRQVTPIDNTSQCEAAGINVIHDERGLSDLVLASIIVPVSAELGPVFIAAGGRVLESLGCYPDWGCGDGRESNTAGRSKALVLGETKLNWSLANAIDTILNNTDGSYEDAAARDDVRPVEQAQYYGAVYRRRFAFIITEKELVVMQLHLAPDPVRTSPRPVRTRPPPSHQRVISSSEISKQLTDMSIDESVLTPRIALVKYKSIPWSAHGECLTIKLALYCLARLADEDGLDLRDAYPPLVSHDIS